MPRMTATATRTTRDILAENLGRLLATEGYGAKSRLAEALGVHPTRISEILAGKANLGIDTIQLLAEYFGCPPENLLSENR